MESMNYIRYVENFQHEFVINFYYIL